MDPVFGDEAVKDQGAFNSHTSYTDKDFEGHRAHSVYIGVHVGGARRHGHHKRHHRHHRHHRPTREDGKGDAGRPVTPPSQRVQFILGENEEDDMHESHPLFSEMEELVTADGEMEWRETARWVKFEEDVEEGGNRWSKPHVATLSLHSLFELRSCLLNGTVMLDCEATNLEQIADLVLDNMINAKCITEDQRERVREILLRRHRHQHEKRHDNNSKGSRIPLIRSLADIGRVHSSSKSIHEGGQSVPQTPASPSGLNEPPQFGRFLSPGHPAGTDTSPGGNSNNGQNNHNEGMTKSPSGGSLPRNQSGPHLAGKDGMTHSASASDMQQLKGNQHFMKKIAPGSEASNILVGELEFLEKTVTAFVRLGTAVILGDLTEVPVPTRFIFILLGPQGNISRYHEIGRAMATLMSDEVFHDVAYKAKKREDLLAGVDEFLDAVTVLPPGEWDPSIRIEPPDKIPSQDHRKGPEQKDEVNTEEEEEREREESGLKRTGRWFGGLQNDFKRKWPWFFWSDFTDALALQCLASFIFLYFACLAPIITFGGLLGEATDNRMAAIESLIAGCVCGFFYALCSGQPMTILSSTGPVLVFETITYSLCKDRGVDYLEFRLWVGVWTGVILLLLVALDASAFVCYITRFTEENFACLISLIFIYKAIEKLWIIREDIPKDMSPNGVYLLDCNCNGTFNQSVTLAPYNYSDNYYFPAQENCERLSGVWDCDYKRYHTHVFLMSIILFSATFFISAGLKEMKNTSFFPTKIREVISDFAVTIAIMSMSLMDMLVGIDTPKLTVPSDFKPTWDGRGWFINPMLNNHWATIPIAIFPALLATILIFMDQQITAVIVNRKEHKLKKGGGYHLDLFILAILIILCSVMGLPWFVAGTVLSVTHVNSLKMESECAAPGEKPQFLGVREQRVTHLLIFIMIGISVLLTPVLKCIPMPVLFGVFLYMGTSSLKGLQFIDRILIMLMPAKYQPDYTFLRQVPIRRVHIFTGIQLTCLIILWVVKSLKITSIAFPLMLVVLIGVRKCLDFVFTRRELQILDDVMPESTKRKQEEEKRRLSEQVTEIVPTANGAQSEAGFTIGPSGNLQIPLANGNIMQIPVGATPPPGINISEEVNKSGLWQQLNNSKHASDEMPLVDKKESSNKKKRGTKKDALNDEERKRLSTMNEDEEEEDGPITIRIETPTPCESKATTPGVDKKIGLGDDCKYRE